MSTYLRAAFEMAGMWSCVLFYSVAIGIGIHIGQWIAAKGFPTKITINDTRK